jgi:hypothetical protein
MAASSAHSLRCAAPLRSSDRQQVAAVPDVDPVRVDIQRRQTPQLIAVTFTMVALLLLLAATVAVLWPDTSASRNPSGALAVMGQDVKVHARCICWQPEACQRKPNTHRQDPGDIPAACW